MDCVLTSIKKLLGIVKEDTSFDADVLMYINSNLVILSQIGVVISAEAPMIDDNTTWEEIIPDINKLEFIKTFIYLKVKLIFDPPLNNAVSDAMKQNINELEWRISVAVDQNVTQLEGVV